MKLSNAEYVIICEMLAQYTNIKMDVFSTKAKLQKMFEYFGKCYKSSWILEKYPKLSIDPEDGHTSINYHIVLDSSKVTVAESVKAFDDYVAMLAADDDLYGTSDLLTYFMLFPTHNA